MVIAGCWALFWAQLLTHLIQWGRYNVNSIWYMRRRLSTERLGTCYRHPACEKRGWERLQVCLLPRTVVLCWPHTMGRVWSALLIGLAHLPFPGEVLEVLGWMGECKNASGWLWSHRTFLRGLWGMESDLAGERFRDSFWNISPHKTTLSWANEIISRKHIIY